MVWQCQEYENQLPNHKAYHHSEVIDKRVIVISKDLAWTRRRYGREVHASLPYINSVIVYLIFHIL